MSLCQNIILENTYFYFQFGTSTRLATKSSQTEMMREDFSDLSALLPGGMDLGCSGEPGKCECESKNTKIIKEVIEKLELKFEQEKREALEKLESKVHSLNFLIMKY